MPGIRAASPPPPDLLNDVCSHQSSAYFLVVASVEDILIFVSTMGPNPMPLINAACLLLLIVTSCLPSEAANIYLSAGGSDEAGCGDFSNPCSVLPDPSPLLTNDSYVILDSFELTSVYAESPPWPATTTFVRFISWPNLTQPADLVVPALAEAVSGDHLTQSYDLSFIGLNIIFPVGNAAQRLVSVSYASTQVSFRVMFAQYFFNILPFPLLQLS